MINKIAMFIVAVLLTGTGYAQAQTRTITGTVYGDETSVELAGASVALKDGKAATSTNEDGTFSIEVPISQTITINVSYTGFLDKQVIIKPTDKHIFVRLTTDNKMLGDVVVTVGYAKVKRANVLGSVATIKAEDIQDLPVANLATALVGRIPGVSINQTSGKPGSTTNLTIRNPVSFSGSANGGSVDPLYIIDGFQLTKEDFDNLDATLVESITFLKDAAASIYGSRGANGVVLVATKRGRPGKPKISYTSNIGISSAIKFPEMLSSFEHASLLNSKFDSWTGKGFKLMNPDQYYTQEELEYLKTHDYNRIDEVWQNSHLNRQTINISGGSDKITFFGGANYYKENGNLSDLFAKKFGLRFGATAKITTGLSATVSLATDYSQLNRPAPKGPLGNNVTEQGDQLNGTMSSLLLAPHWLPLTYNGLAVGNANVWSPLELQNSNSYSRSRSQGVTLNASLEYKVPKIEGLTARVSYGLSSRNTYGKEYYVPYNLNDFALLGEHGKQPAGGSGPDIIQYPALTYQNFGFNVQNVIFSDSSVPKLIENGNFISQSHGSSTNYQLNETVSYARKFNKHDISILVGAEQSESSGEDFKIQQPEVQVPGIDELYAFSSDRSLATISGASSEAGRMSYFSRLNYNYFDRYLLEATFRADASPNFPPSTRWGYFPSVAVGWVVSEENFFRKHVAFINNLKFRYQVGLTGNDNTSNYQYKESYGIANGYLFGSTLAGGLSVRGNRSTPNPIISWEKALYRNFGMDGNMMNRKINFSVDIYNRRNYDMLNTPTSTLPTTSGAVVSDINYGELKSWGTEASIGYSGSFTPKFKFNLTTNFGWSDNKVIKKFTGTADTGYKNQVGRRTDSGIEGYVATGIIRNQGELDAFNKTHPNYKIGTDTLRLGYMTFQDLNGDGIINDGDKSRLVSRAGSRMGVAFIIGLTYGDFKLSTNIAYSIGGQVAYDKTVRTPPTEGAGSLSIWNDSWTAQNPNAKYPAINSPLVTEVYDMWIVSATNMRVNNMTLSYSLPVKIAQKLRLPQFRAYITGTNMWDIINNRPYKYSATNVAVDYPALRTYTFAISINL
ncbi:MAG: SusC/RagA family TonB-linked outer membrane protein [Bacteroidota bacterium]